MKRILALGVMLSVLGCGKEVGRVPLAGVGSATSTITLKAGEVAFWTDIDIDYDGDAALSYDVDLSQGGKSVASVTCDPLAQLSVKTSWVETNIGTKHSRRGNGKMACSATIGSGGATVVTVKLAFTKKPASVTLGKADLAIRQ